MQGVASILFEHGIWPFVLLTIFIGGGMAIAAGGAVAGGWKTMRHLVFYVFLLTLTERFLQFALYKGTLLSVRFFITSFIILLVFALLGYTWQRRQQMQRQYGFLARTAN